jgi:E3 ubiquitin-protein ligase SHPRH
MVQESLRRFNDEPDCNVLLLASGPAASGLTLTIANTLYVLEPTDNAAQEAQAVSRVHRIGQTKNTRCVIFYARGTHEERILALRQERGQVRSVVCVCV